MSKLSEALYPYQKDDVQFMLEHNRCINGNACGLGKTIEALALIEQLGTRHNLIIAPKTLLSEWSMQTERWLGVDCFTPWSDNNLHKLPPFFCINYDLLATQSYLNTLQKIPWDIIIFDECHRLKSYRSSNKKSRNPIISRKHMTVRVYNALQLVPESVSRVVMMSGTPIQNSPADLYTLFHIIDPKNVDNYDKWTKMFCVWEELDIPVRNSNGKVINSRPIHRIVSGETNNPEKLNILLHAHMTRHEKKDVLPDLPDKQYRAVPTELGLERKQYESMTQQLFALLDSGERITAPQVMAQITRLRQITLEPNLLSKETEKVSTPSNKTLALLELIEDTDDKVVVFSCFAQYINILSNELTNHKIKHVTVTGQTNAAERGKLVQTFQNDNSVKVFLGSMAATGEGITLTASHTIIFTDLPWNPATMWQAEDRLHRIGQKDSVSVIDLYNKNTIEQHLHDIVRRKIAMFEQIVIANVVERMRTE